jgi:dihydroorotate dehydrogenase electron transfer subunit
MFWPDRAIQTEATILANEPLARQTYRVRFVAPEIARRITPGQFLMLKVPGDDPLLGRPLALYDTIPNEVGEPWAIDVVYLVQGNMTQRLATLREGQTLSVWGPLGNGFLPEPADRMIAVAGGIGYTPFLALAHEMLGTRRYGEPERSVAPVRNFTLLYGARSAEYFAGLEDFEAAGITLRLSTDDGSRGFHGLVTHLLNEALAEPTSGITRIVSCGPEPMMAAVARIAEAAGIACRVSLETPMACGLGICFSCVAKIRTPDGWDYRRTCVEGPVFDGQCVEFD